MSEEEKTGLALLRSPFGPNQISQLPKPSRTQTDIVKKDYKLGVRCTVCGGWHHPDVIHLDYVGHAALTDRLLDADPKWNWEPLAMNEYGLPMLDGGGGLWIKLTVCGVTRLGYGDADGKKGGNAIKEAIGDGLRNAGMRFGAALDLWHKGDLHVDEPTEQPKVELINADQITVINDMLKESGGELAAFLELGKISSIEEMPAAKYHKAVAMLEKKIFNNKEKQ